ncbi:hypothetical protein POVWA2_040060 [Plasmodium ovale wallikeri]|uniref:Uncharacterized protein n=1 Tax=Plasmodium ovale wallikeri TaxID=864142 RepID=A0A1A8Z9W8_PLAOA|nr:hypothetical protein POVWA1_041500 [Plasmodium ovale wallikeri]SBT40606.1 hypothetical protein POVWA2_040060 [Plasmodium ovale wallikeri]
MRNDDLVNFQSEVVMRERALATALALAEISAEWMEKCGKLKIEHIAHLKISTASSSICGHFLNTHSLKWTIRIQNGVGENGWGEGAQL